MTSIDRNQERCGEFEPARMHQALFYVGDQEYRDAIMRFIAPGLAAGEPVALAIPPERGEQLRRALNGHAADVQVLDIFELGRNPARIIPAVERMLSKHEGATLHYVGEQIWPGRSGEEIQEATKHEALINLAWPGSSVRVLCPYDAQRLPAEVLRDAMRTHPVVSQRGKARRSPTYDRATIPLCADRPLPRPPPDARQFAFGARDLSRARAMVAEEAGAAGLSVERVQDLTLAVSELAGNAIRHGHGGGRLRVWTRPDRVICQVEDSGHIRDPLAGRRLPHRHATGGLGLWTVNQLCDLVELRSTPTGTTARVHARLG